MIRSVAFFALLAALSSVSYGQDTVIDKKEIELCQTETNVQEADLNNLKEKKLPETKEGKCFLACVMQKMKIMSEDGKFDLEGAKAASQYLKSPDKIEKGLQIAEFCAADVKGKEGNDKCENAMIISICTRAKGNELGLEE